MQRALDFYRKMPKTLVATLMVLISIISVQLGASFSVKLYPAIGVVGTTTLRQLFAAIILALIFKPWENFPARAHWRDLIIYGVVIGVMNLTFYYALQTVPQGIAVAIEFLGPLGVAIFASRRWWDALWVTCAVVGLVLLLPLRHGAAALDLGGVLWALCAAVMWGVYILIGHRLSRTVDAGKAVAIGMIISTVLILPLGVADQGVRLLDPKILGLGLMVSVLASAIPYGFEMVALKHIPAKTFSLMMSLEPAFGTLMGMVILQQSLLWPQLLAIGMVIIASMGSSLMHEPEPDHP
jgi:inner membrane transporter RhtA